MSASLEESKSLFTGPEWKILESSMPGNIENLTLYRVKQKVVMTRRLLDKWRDQSIKQSRTANDKTAASRSKEKVKHFSTALKAFEKLEKKLAGEAARAELQQKKDLLKKSKAADDKKSKKPAGTAKPLKGSSKSESLTSKKSEGHVSARNKRNQAKKDNR